MMDTQFLKIGAIRFSSLFHIFKIQVIKIRESASSAYQAPDAVNELTGIIFSKSIQHVKCLLSFLCTMCFCVCSVNAKPSLGYLQLAYSCWGTKEDCVGFATAFEKTECDVVSFLESDDVELTKRDLMVISAFSTQRYTLRCFMKSSSFNRARHEKLLLNLFRLSAKIACLYRPDDPKVEAYGRVVYQNQSIERIMSETEGLYQSVGEAIDGQIDWQD